MQKKLKFIQYYEKLILSKPGITVFLLILIFIFFGFWVKDFRIDASADSFVLEHDQALNYYRKIIYKYYPEDFLSVIYSPLDENLFSEKNLNTLKKIRDEIKRIESISSVLTILDVPLFQSPPVSLKDIQDDFITLESPRVNKKLAIKELKYSTLYKNLLISSDLKSSVIQVNFKRDLQYEKLLLKKTDLFEKKLKGELTPLEETELEKIKSKLTIIHDLKRKREDLAVAKIRNILNQYRSQAKIFLGGVAMIGSDMISFIKNDLTIFGTGIIIFFIIILGIVFRSVQWIILPILCSVFSVITMMGYLGLTGIQVTVVSANFIALQLIFTMAIAIHIIVRFNELLKEKPEADYRDLIIETVHTIFKPCLYTSLTTIAGFSSLIFSDILPVVNFGWMMSIGLCISFLITFLFLPSCFLLFQRKISIRKERPHLSITRVLAKISERFSKTVVFISCLVAFITMIGIFQLEVENSFIDYFKKSTEIYQGMKYYDQNFGGTTPLDIIIDFEKEEEEEYDPEFDDEDEDNDIYWYTEEKIDLISKIHEYIDKQLYTGKVLSFKSYFDVMTQINDGKELDDYELKIVIKKLPEDIKDIILRPYISVQDNQARLTVNIKDSEKGLKRNQFLKQIHNDLKRNFIRGEERIHLTNLMVLYNNMLQSLYSSQIKSIGYTILALMIMFLFLFGSLKISVIAIIPNIISCFIILGFMGISGISLDMMTITIVAISMGIAVDNTIHYIHRFKHEFKKDSNYLNTMYRCHESIGKALYYTAITIVFGFSILSLSNFIPSITFGLLTSLAMLIALTSSLTLLPILIRHFKPF